MKLLKTSVLNGIAFLIKIAAMFVLNKILAVYVGPTGYAAISQFQNFTQMIITFAGTAINTGVVKYTSEYYEDENKQRELWQTAGSIVVICSFLLMMLIILFQKPIIMYLFHSAEYQIILVWFSIFLIFFSFNALLLAILNGKEDITKLVIVNIFGSIFSLIITSLLAMKFGLKGALIALSIYQSLNLVVTVMLCYRTDWFKFKYLFGKINKEIAQKLSVFAAMALVSVFFGNIAQIWLRKIIISEFGMNYAGYWDAMTKLSDGYLMLVGSILSIYYIPKLSQLHKYTEIKEEVNYGYKWILPIAIITCLTIFILKEWIVHLLFTDQFLPMLQLLAWQLIGDIIKIGSWIVSFMMLSKAMTKIFISTEVFFALSIIPLTVLFIEFWGFKGIAIAFAANYLFYWIVCSYLAFEKLKEV
ncbi:O-antigen translocase [Acinetobacter sp. ANC 5378]|uniref:O-antigen translocase n=1 Tax=Acinetobacter sp. ANC 5378 TaxID=2731249 RepID=UPI00148FCAD6|nr:O-antigen translocase [Acinetobacter sp. ANC 5378]NNG81651.1 O-antigen translocase [Acinetobacter sp. ANC 5378]